MKNLRNQIRKCKACDLCKTMPGTLPVPGIGPSDAKIFLIGEALGEDESLLEEPLLGRCGKLLNKILSQAGLKREELFLSNCVRCRPTKTIGKRVSNRPPTSAEIAQCSKWLISELTNVQPEVILTLGKVPTYALLSHNLKKSFKLGDLVGKSFASILPFPTLIFPCYHPSYLMQNSKDKIDMTIELFKKIRIII